jgi:hypothetical protein
MAVDVKLVVRSGNAQVFLRVVSPYPVSNITPLPHAFLLLHVALDQPRGLVVSVSDY